MVFSCLTIFCFKVYISCCVILMCMAPCGGKESSKLKGGVAPPGHMLPLGSHQPPEGHIHITPGFRKPEDFYENHVKPAVPVLFKGAARTLPAYQLWGDEYLSEMFGDFEVDVEVKKKENRSDYSYPMPLKVFLSKYTAENIYMVQDVLEPMFDDLGIPRPLQCGGLQKLISALIIWLSSGGTKSVLHFDEFENINCLLDGSKDFVLIDREYFELVEADGFDNGHSSLDVERVDLYKFPEMRHIPWWNAHMEAGDCLYIPLSWYHHVHSHAGHRNLAVNYWFQHMFWFNETDCDVAEAMNDFPSIDTSLIMDEDKSRLEVQRRDLFWSFGDMGEVSFSELGEIWGAFLEPFELEQAFQRLDRNSDQIISMEEISTADVAWIVETFELFAEDLDEDYENDDPYDLDPDHIFHRDEL